jgi:hypothetical protein
VNRGVVERKARQLALDIPDDQPVFDQIEYAEHFIQQDRRDDFCQLQISKKLESDDPPERMETALKEHLKSIKREQPGWFARVPDATPREVALSRLKASIREHLALPSFERWQKQTRHPGQGNAGLSLHGERSSPAARDPWQPCALPFHHTRPKAGRMFPS